MTTQGTAEPTLDRLVPADGPNRIQVARRWLRSYVLRQVALLSLGRVAAGLVSAAWMIIAARRLSVGAFGDLALLLSLGLIFSSLSDFGFTALLSDVVARQPGAARDAFVRTVRSRMPMGAAGALGVGAAYLLAARDDRLIIPLIFAVSMIATTVYGSATAVFRAMGRVGAEAANEVASRLFVLAAGAWLLFHGGGLLGAVTTYALADGMSALVLGGLALAKTAGARDSLGPGELAFRRALPLAVAGWLATLYYRVDVYILALMAGSQAVGLYASCYRIFEGLLLPATAISALAVPLTAGIDHFEVRKRLRKLSLLGLVVTVPVGVLVAANAGRSLRFLLGPQYGSAGNLLVVLLLGLIPSVLVGIFGTRATLLNGRAVARGLGCCLTLDVVLNVVAVPRYGAYAAAWATTISQTALALLLARVLVRSSRHETPVRDGH